MAGRSQARFLLFLALTWCVAFVGAELLAQAGFHLLPGSSRLRRLAYPSRFSLHRMARLVDDPRVSTLVPGYRAVLSEAHNPSNPPWRVEIDENGFRGRQEHYEGRRRVVAFIGDSVPFGWGVSDEATVPFRFRALLDERGRTDLGVLNGALPSYSLVQAVERYRREIWGKYPVATVIVQTFDPVIMFSLLGEGWDPSISFSSRYRDPTRPLLGPLEDYLDKSLLFGAALRVAYRAGDRLRNLPTPVLTEAAWRKFDEANHATLLRLLDATEPDRTSVVLLPVNPGAEPETAYSADERRVIRHFNRFLVDFASSRPRVRFLDVEERFRASPQRAALFVDNCCHLSPHGTRLQAELLFEKLEQVGLLGPTE